jgi:GDP-L-fucose synthase
MKKILITGGSGMVGSAFMEIEAGYELILVGSRDYDLTSWYNTLSMVERINPDAIIHLAAKVGGIKANIENQGDFYTINSLINTNVLKASKDLKVKKVVSLMSTCIYPDLVSYPLTEDQIHDGPPHISNYAYAYAKRMLDVQSRAYRDQYGCNFITAVPNNLFGENDNFDLENSHVIPAMIRKMWEAKLNNKDVALWGDGSPLREFTYSKDLAEILLFLLEHYNEEYPINVGNTNEISIKTLAETISEILNFKGKIIWDTTKPKGQHRKPSSNSKLLDLGWRKENYTNFKKALTKTCEWVILKYPSIRGIK